MKALYSFFIFLILFSCRDNLSDPENCILETNTLYLKDAPEGQAYYRIDRIEGDKMYVSIWKPITKKWYDLRERPKNFFVDNKVFKYQKVVCPDFKRSERLSDKVKAIHLFKRTRKSEELRLEFEEENRKAGKTR